MVSRLEEVQVHVNDGSAERQAMAWSEGYSEGFNDAQQEVARLEAQDRIAASLLREAKAQQEVVRLRTALEWIVETEPSVGAWDGWHFVEQIRWYARTALAAVPEAPE